MAHLNVINLQSGKMRKLSLAQSHLKYAVINLLPEQTLFSIVLIYTCLFQIVLKIKSGISFIYIFTVEIMYLFLFSLSSSFYLPIHSHAYIRIPDNVFTFLLYHVVILSLSFSSFEHSSLH